MLIPVKRILSTIVLAAAVVLGAAAPAAADPNDFYFESFDAHYSLSTDEGGHSVLSTVEELVAVFPDFDQTRGILRLLVDDYDGHPTDIHVLSVTDENGAPRPYELEEEDGFVQLRIGDENIYLHGHQTYRIAYVQRNVTRFYADTDADEFYWDTNGTGWSQPFQRVTATVELDPALRDRLTGQVDAASGRQGEDGPVEVMETPTGFVFEATDLGPGENLSFAIGFEPGTFVERDGSFFASPFPSIALLFTLLALGVTGGAIALRRRRLLDAPGRGIIVPEYLPPKGVSVFLASLISKHTTKATVAGIMHLAVSGALRVREVGEGRKPHYDLQFVSADGVTGDDLEFMHALFGPTFEPDELHSLKTADQKAVKAVTALMKRVTEDATTAGYRRKPPAGLVGLVCFLAIATGVGGVVFSAASLDLAYGGWVPGLLLAVSIVAGIASFALVLRTPLDPAGVELRDYLRGLEQYIRLAEADRIRYLQSPQGAERMPVDTDDRAQIVRLNERLLPYAVLFGLEKEWAAELGRYYEELGEQPGWFVGHGAFNAALFSSSVGAMSTSAASAYTASTGGSGGGASSGGGGGGGGGGGF